MNARCRRAGEGGCIRVTSIWPFTNKEYFEVTDAVDLGDYEVIE